VIIASVISDKKFHIEANIPEVDIGKIAVGNPVSITFDAFPDETFTGSVAKIDPAETIVDGVVNFKTTVAIESPDARLKSGLTANLSIETVKKTGVPILPQSAITETREGTFVKRYENGVFVDREIKTGIRDKNGNIEIVSGVSEGDQVQNVGLRTSK
jgi:HlyD family secretion protein